MARGIKVWLGPGHIVLDGDPSTPLPKKEAPQFSAHFYCGLTAGCIKMSLGMEVGLSPGDFVLDGDPLPSPNVEGVGFPPNFQRPLWLNYAWGPQTLCRWNNVLKVLYHHARCGGVGFRRPPGGPKRCFLLPAALRAAPVFKLLRGRFEVIHPAGATRWCSDGVRFGL